VADSLSDRVTVLEQRDIAVHERLTLIDSAVREGTTTVFGEVKRLNGEILAINRWRWMATGGFTVLVFLVATLGVYVLTRLA